jgi:hypothetical protein
MACTLTDEIELIMFRIRAAQKHMTMAEKAAILLHELRQRGWVLTYELPKPVGLSELVKEFKEENPE